MTRSWAGTAASQQAGSAATARRSPGLRERAPLAAAVTQRPLPSGVGKVEFYTGDLL